MIRNWTLLNSQDHPLAKQKYEIPLLESNINMADVNQ